MTFDFEIDVAASGENGYPVTVRSPNGGEATALMRLTPEIKALAARAPDSVVASSAVVRRALAAQERPVRDLGGLLFQALISGDVHSLLVASRQQAAMSGDEVRIVLRIAPAEVACLPWEFLFDPGDDDYVCLSTPLVRRPQLLRPVRPLDVTGPLRVLGMVASPDDQAALATSEERRRLTTAMSTLASQVDLTWADGEGWRDLKSALRHGGPWHVLHFIGHGGFDRAAGEGMLALTGEDGRSHPLPASDLALLIERHPSLRMVVLNACDTGQASEIDALSSVAGALLRRGIPAVLAMQFPITDHAAIEFSRTFYEGLADHLPVDIAVTEARHAVRISMPSTLEWGTPVLYLRSAKGTIFAPRDEQTGTAGAAAQRPSGIGHPEPGPARSPKTSDRKPASTYALQYTIPIVRHAGYATFSPDGTLLAVASGTTAQIVEAASGRTRTTLVHPGFVLRGVAFSPDGHRVAMGSSDGTAIVCDTATGDRCFRIRANWSSTQLQDLEFSPDGRLLIVAGEDKTAQLYDAASGQRQRALPHDGVVYDLEISPDGRLLATASLDGTALVWDISTGRKLVTLRHNREVYGVAFSPDGRLVATASRDKRARIWDVASGQMLRVIEHSDAVLGTAFSRDGLLATACADRTARIWYSDTGRLCLALPHEGIVDRAVFSPDGRRIVTVTRHRCAQVWQFAERAGD